MAESEARGTVTTPDTQGHFTNIWIRQYLMVQIMLILLNQYLMTY